MPACTTPPEEAQTRLRLYSRYLFLKCSTKQAAHDAWYTTSHLSFTLASE